MLLVKNLPLGLNKPPNLPKRQTAVVRFGFDTPRAMYGTRHPDRRRSESET